MLKCSYILYVHNNEKTISRVIDSLTKINGNFRREFIIIDDGSTDNTLYIIKDHIKALPRATVITQEHMGSAVSNNKALSLIKSDYIHFVSATYETFAHETAELIEACTQHDAGLAFYSYSKHKKNAKAKAIEVIEFPIKEILAGDKFSNICSIGEASSLVSFNLLVRVNGADEEIFTLSPSLALRCASASKFVCIFKEASQSPQKHVSGQRPSSNFNDYNELLAIYNFIKEKPEVAEKYVKELIYYLYKNSHNLKRKLNFLQKYFAAKYLNEYNSRKVAEWYLLELKKLF